MSNEQQQRGNGQPQGSEKPMRKVVRLRLSSGVTTDQGMPRELRVKTEKAQESPSGNHKLVERMELYPAPLGVVGVLVTFGANRPQVVVPWGSIECADLANG